MDGRRRWFNRTYTALLSVHRGWRMPVEFPCIYNRLVSRWKKLEENVLMNALGLTDINSHNS